MKILVTGATGFVGNYVVAHAMSNGHEVIATSNKSDQAAQCDWYNEIEYKLYDFNSCSDNLYEYFGKPQILIHLAWDALDNYKEKIHVEKIFPMHVMFLKNMIEGGLKNLTVTGTCLEYGLQEGCLTEDMAALPVTAYGSAKNKLREWLEQFQSTNAFSMKWLRLFYLHGRGQSSKSLLSQLDTALSKGDSVFPMSGGRQLRDYLSVETAAEYIVTAAIQNEVNGVIHCCSGQPIAIRELVENYLYEKGRNIELDYGVYPYPEYEPMEFWGSSLKLNKILFPE
ncbi:NAD(P)-dependent oxidoreductase [bacterium]|nr:NAD(P)-dependent oxidoreductase [bacterium]